MSDSGPSDADLARQISEGRKDAEQALSRRYERGVIQILVRQTGSYAIAQELCQETLIIVLKRLRSTGLQNPEKLSAFVAQTARNLAIAERRKQRRRSDLGRSAARHERLDTLMGGDFKQYRANISCGRPNCSYVPNVGKYSSVI